MYNHHRNYRTFDLEPDARSVAVSVAVVVGAVMLLYSGIIPDGVWCWLLRAAIVVAALLVTPKLLSWYAGIALEHYTALREANAITEDTVEWLVRERMMEQYERLILEIRNLQDDRIEAFLSLPSPARLELTPEKVDFLILSHTGKRTPMTIVREVAGQWVRMVGAGRNPWLLPPIRLWNDSKEREMVRELYAEMAAQGIVRIRTIEGEPWAGNQTATVAQHLTPLDVLRWMRVDSEYTLETESEDA